MPEAHKLRRRGYRESYRAAFGRWRRGEFFMETEIGDEPPDPSTGRIPNANVRERAVLNVAPPLRLARPLGRAPRRATNARTRGSRRGSSSSSSDDPDGEDEPPGGFVAGLRTLSSPRDPWAFTRRERWPACWRLAALRCRVLERLEEAGR